MSGEKSCGAVIFDERGRVLLIEQCAGHIAFPKGHVEPGESERETARREVREETGLEIVIEDGFRAVERYRLESGVMKEVVLFLATPVGGALRAQPGEVAALGWYEPDDALGRITYADSRQILRDAIRFREEKR